MPSEANRDINTAPRKSPELSIDLKAVISGIYGFKTEHLKLLLVLRTQADT